MPGARSGRSLLIVSPFKSAPTVGLNAAPERNRIALETSKGDLPLALGLGFVLIALVIVLNFAAHATRAWSRARFG